VDFNLRLENMGGCWEFHGNWPIEMDDLPPKNGDFP
jgi:hypothetical protein